MTESTGRSMLVIILKISLLQKFLSFHSITLSVRLSSGVPEYKECITQSVKHSCDTFLRHLCDTFLCANVWYILPKE